MGAKNLYYTYIWHDESLAFFRKLTSIVRPRRISHGLKLWAPSKKNPALNYLRDNYNLTNFLKLVNI